MNEDRYEHRFNRRWEYNSRKKEKDRVFGGIFLLIVGCILLLKTSHLILFPSWFFDWPTILIALGLFTGIKHHFRGGAWLILILIGGLYLADRVNPGLNLGRFIWPLVIIAMGLLFIFKPKRIYRPEEKSYSPEPSEYPEEVNKAEHKNFTNDSREVIDITSVMSGVRKNIMSKNFRGGDIVCFMGGAELDLTQADITGRVKIDATNIFGGTKLIVPPTWDVQSDVTAIFGGVDDKRQINGIKPDPDKVLILDGTCMFGGIEIRSF
ncbi:MAG TPA: DUF5668 domain-containing protein [Flavisolibacter sp.]|nr:DUF5668 domain-containing protein [Flavisolibacter sp.]